ncbi:MAG: ArgK/MeaB family GTPase [Planctomycetaceae bacterium]
MIDAAELSELIARFHAGDRAALNRLISLVARGESLDSIRAALEDGCGRGRVIALTGNSGVGKSSLIARLIELIRSRGENVAVLACDPESALTGGALLGDRVRMSAHAGDEGVWIRSLASASGRQAIADHLDLAAGLLGRFGFDHILLETVGAGQGDVAVDGLADVVVLLIQPEIGDELQWEKAGVLEVADIVAVHKGDLPGAERTQSQAREQLNLPGSHETPVLRVSSKTNMGIAELWSAIAACADHKVTARRNPRVLLRLVQEHVAYLFAAHPDAVQAIADHWKEEQLTSGEAVEQVLATILKRSAAAGHGNPSDC